MKSTVKYFLVTMSVGFSLTCLSAKASLPLPVRFSAAGYGSTDYSVGRADVMVPLKGSTACRNIYINPAVAYGTDTLGYADLGIGYRVIKNSSAILGGYLFGGYSGIANNARLWIINPGLEALGERWDAHLNGYHVMGDRNKTISSYTTFNSFGGHSAFYNKFGLNQHAGDGADAIFGYQLFRGAPLKTYVGSYFFMPAQTNNILGGAVGLEYWATKNVKVFANYAYDNLQRSVGAVGVGVEFGGTRVSRTCSTVEERLTDPVERYLSGVGRGSAIPTPTKLQLLGLVVPDGMGSLTFFTPTGSPNNGGRGLTINNCTFENPCGPTDLTNQGTQTLSTLLPKTTMYFLEGGTYSALDIVGGSNPVVIRPGQTINTFPTDPETPPANFTGGFILGGNNTLNNITLNPTASTATGAGISATNGGYVVVNSSQIGSASAPFATGLNLSGSTQATLNNSTVYASSNGANLAGISSLTANQSVFSVGGSTFGINSTSSGSIFLNGSAVNLQGSNGIVGVSSTGGGNVGLAGGSVINVIGAQDIVGLQTQGAGTVTVSEASSINVGATGSNPIGYYNQGGSGAVSFSGSRITVNAPGQATAIGIQDTAGASGNITADASVINVQGAANTVGINSAGTGNLTLTGTSMSVAGADTSSGIAVTGGRAINVSNGALVFVGGNGSAGFSSTGDGNIALDGNTWNFTEGNNSYGFNFKGDGDITVNNDKQTATGGTNFIGFDMAGPTATATVTGSAFNVTAGSNSFVSQIEGGGPISFGTSSITMNGTTGSTATGGINTLSSSTSTLSLSGTPITVTGGASSVGLSSNGIGSVTVSDSPIKMTAKGANVQGVNIAGSGEVNVVNSPITMQATSQAGATGFATSAASTSEVTLNGAPITVNGGANAQGLSIAGSGDVDVLGNSPITVNAVGFAGATGISIASTAMGTTTLDANFPINVTGGDTTTGINNLGTGALNVMNGNPITVKGGDTVIAFNNGGSGAVNIGNNTLTVNATGAGTGLGTAAGSSNAITATGTQITVTGNTGTSRGANLNGSGNVDLTNVSIKVDGADARGISSGMSTVTITGGTIDVTAYGAGGVFVAGGSFNLQGGTIITVNGGPGRGPGGGLAQANGLVTIASGSSITGNDITVTVDKAGSVGGQNSALWTSSSPSATITIGGSKINAIGVVPLIKTPNAGPITITSSVCTLNGVIAAC
jgi:hypothetical protein